MAKNKIYEFTVEGYGFPFDMLRYNRAWPAHEDETYQLGPHYPQRNKITMVIHSLDFPAINRWESFGFKVRDVRPLVFA